MNQNLLDHIDSTLRNKTLPVKKKSKADIVMQKMFDAPQPKVSAEQSSSGDEGTGTIG
jgi:hypothetical protein